MSRLFVCVILMFVVLVPVNPTLAADVTIQFVPFRPQLNPPPGEVGAGSPPDKIILNDGTVIEGIVTKFVNDHYTIKVGNFEKVLHQSLIKSINDKVVVTNNGGIAATGAEKQTSVTEVSVMPFQANDLMWSNFLDIAGSSFTVFPERLGSAIPAGSYESDYKRVYFQKEFGELKRKLGGSFPVSEFPTFFKLNSFYVSIDTKRFKNFVLYTDRKINAVFPYEYWPLGFGKQDELLFALIQRGSNRGSDYGNINKFAVSKEVYSAKFDLTYAKEGKYASIGDGITVDGPVLIINHNELESVYNKFLTSTDGGRLPTNFASAGKASKSPNWCVAINEYGMFDYIIPSNLRDPKRIDNYQWFRAVKDANGINIKKVRSIDFTYPENVFGHWTNPNTGSNAILYGKFLKGFGNGVAIILVERMVNEVTQNSSCKGKITFFHESGSVEREFKLPFAIDRFSFYCVDIDSDGIDEIIVPCLQYPGGGDSAKLVEIKF